MMSLRPEDLVEPIEFGVGELTPERLGIDMVASPYSQPPDEPEPVEAVDEDVDSEVPVEFQSQSLRDEVITRASEGLGDGLRLLFDRPVITIMFLFVGVGSFFLGKRSSNRHN